MTNDCVEPVHITKATKNCPLWKKAMPLYACSSCPHVSPISKVYCMFPEVPKRYEVYKP